MDRKAPTVECAFEPSGRARLALSGTVTVPQAAEVHRAALELTTLGCDVTVCCAGAEYLDAAVVQVLLALGRDLTRRGRRCEVTGVAGRLAGVFKVAGLG